MGLDWGMLKAEDRAIVDNLLGKSPRAPDLTITTEEGADYLYRWHMTERSYEANDYFHIQTSSDPERPLHDHPWDNMSVILAGGYNELRQENPPDGTVMRVVRAGATVFRKAHEAHRLILPPGIPYTMTRFFTGPAKKDWGFWIARDWYPASLCTRDIGGGRSVFIYPPGTSEHDNRHQTRQ